MNSNVGCQMSGWEECEPARDVLFAERESLSGKQDEWIENGAPGDLVFVERVVKMAGADRVLSQDQRAVSWIPDRESPVAYEHGKAIRPPLLVSRCDDRHVRGVNGQDIRQPADKFRAVVQAAVPGNDGARRQDMRLRFAARLLRRVESVIEDADVALGVGTTATIWSVRTYDRVRFFEIAAVYRLAIEIPSSKLDAHS